MSMVEIDPIKALVGSAIVNGVISVPIMVVMMWIGQSHRIMGSLAISPRHRFSGWAATVVMGLVVCFMLLTSFFLGAGVQAARVPRQHRRLGSARC